jgi:hypothetical protein
MQLNNKMKRGEYNRPKLDIEVVWNTPYLNVGIPEGLEEAT